ncbi:hypothetical protein F5Y14DRAFT_154633 [Nemania sp. NC0429]|nr:hypothetical protein F5Y14DRAFT_154633 [Nemania sp. NC0429]
MRLFRHRRKHRQEHDQVQTTVPSSPKAKPGHHGLERYLSRSHRGATSTSLVAKEPSEHSSAVTIIDTHPPSDHGGSPTNLSLWGRAYETLKHDDPSLVEEYEKLLSTEAQDIGSASNTGFPTQATPSVDDVSRGTDARSRQSQLETVIAKGLRRFEDSKTTYTIAGHQYSPRDQVAQVAGFMLWAKDLVGEAVKQAPEASIAWAGVCIVLPLLTNPIIADEANRDGFTYVTTRMRYYTELEPLLQRLSENQEVAPALTDEVNNQIMLLYQKILEFQIRSVLRFYQNGLGRYVGDVLQIVDWKQRRLDIETLENTVNRNLEQMNQLVSRRELEVLNKTSSKSLEAMQQFLSVSKEQLRVAENSLDVAEDHRNVAEDHRNVAKRGLEIQENQIKKNLSDTAKNCLQLFRLTNSAKDATYEWYKDRVEDRVAGTCEWFLNHENFRTWLGNDSGPLLVSADPGCGKSVLAKYLIDHKLPGHSATICYFFFKDQDQDTVRQALCALLHQLFTQKPSLINHALKEYYRDGEGLINSMRSLWTVFENAVQDPRAGPVIMVLDALDECAESEFEILIRNLKNQFRKDAPSHTKLKFLLTSRPYDQIVSEFENFIDTFPYVRIPGEEESETIGQEVNSVIKYRVEKLADEKRLSSKVKSHLANRLLEIPHRTYLWVHLVFDYLKKEHFQKTSRGIDDTMASLPTTIYQAYEQILNRSKEHPMVRLALSIILAARRPLTVSEMKLACSIDTKTQSIIDSEEENQDFKLRLRSWCGLFVSIHHEKVYFLHQTAKEFLSESPPSMTISSAVCWQNSITNRNAHEVLAEACIVYLYSLNSDNGPTDEDEHGNKSGETTFLEYAATNWSDHFLNACVADDADMVSTASKICDPDSRSCSIWFKIYWRTTQLGTLEPPTSFFILSYLGHGAIVRRLPINNADIEHKDQIYGRTPLSWAAGNGHEAVVQVLVEKGADLESKDIYYGQTPVSRAASKGHEGVVRLLLEKGADIESKDTEYDQAPLSWAAEKGQEKVVRLLLAKGANIEARDNLGRTALSWAAEWGREDIGELLLKNGADLESEDNLGRTALWWATETKEEAVVKLLQSARYQAKSQT